MSFIGLEKAYDRVNRKALWLMLRMYDVGVKLLDGIKSMCDDSPACVRVKWDESEPFRIVGGEARVYHVPLAVQCIYGWSDEVGE